jgi:hypothetical protein
MPFGRMLAETVFRLENGRMRMILAPDSANQGKGSYRTN